MIPIGGDHRVPRFQNRERAHRDCLLPDVEVAESLDEGPHEGLGRFLFEAADANHLAIELDLNLGAQGRGGRFRLRYGYARTFHYHKLSLPPCCKAGFAVAARLGLHIAAPLVLSPPTKHISDPLAMSRL
ncbi:protein of unknown function [Methylacidimicrobium sp. AP8]|nr:protein of unknown function [Methylacidimicrobium sp. AP8]